MAKSQFSDDLMDSGASLSAVTPAHTEVWRENKSVYYSLTEEHLWEQALFQGKSQNHNEWN
ncbi:hypothetical protein [Cyclobacterium plantarum]|uniref:hypothetical protein n=1 Tax=Cyclobacterium plantarum TaxID=2716263 RepID=UPI003F6EA633